MSKGQLTGPDFKELESSEAETELDVSLQFSTGRRKRYLLRAGSPFPKIKLQAQMASLVNSMKLVRKKKNLYKLTLRELKMGIQTTQRYNEKRKPQTSICHECRHKNSTILANQTQQHIKSIIHNDLAWFILRMQDSFSTR